ncbi:MAG: helix-turn-helix domain-containing protein [Candidatus Anammoxibacter sp.]
MTKEIEFTESCGNVFTDLGFEDAEEMLAKSTLAIMIREILTRRKLTQVKAAKLLGAHQTQLARLKDGKGVDCMSLDLLMHWLTKLDHDVTVTVKRKSRSHAPARIKVAV